jgi:predicted ATPase
MDGSARPVPFISRVRLKNYKSIAECDVRLGPLTILIGPNGTGKSNFLDALAFLSRAVATAPHEAIDEHGGLDEVLRRVPEVTSSFSIDVEVTVPVMGRPDGPATGWYGFEIARASAARRSFKIIREDCSLDLPGHSEHFQLANGLAQDFSVDTPLLEARIELDQLYLPAARRSGFAALYRSLREVQLYNFGLDDLRRPQPKSAGADLGRRGEHLADVLGALEVEGHIYKARLDSYLRAIVPDVVGIDRRLAGAYVTVMLRAMTGHGGSEVDFGPEAMSDGTIRAAAVLAALFQPGTIDGRIPLVGIEVFSARLNRSRSA